jgi:glycosyltransferase involved in cell wall biosynthesis
MTAPKYHLTSYGCQMNKLDSELVESRLRQRGYVAAVSETDADVVLNTSYHEGAAPTLLEAGLLGRAIVAADVPGNRELLRHKETGLLFADEQQMAQQILALYRNRSAAGAMGVRVREDFQRRFGADRELGALLSAYAAA